LRLGVTAWLLLCLPALHASGQEPPLPAVLERAGAYAAQFQQQLASIVSEEHYVQEWTKLPKRWPLRSDPRRRDLRSDLLLVKPPSGNEWIQFRDVIEADGLPIGNRSDRALKLFLEAPPNAEVQLAHILDESSRYNIGNIQRTLNTPMLAMVFLDPANQHRFRFFRSKDRKPQLPLAGPAADCWVIRYEEVEPNTMIRTTGMRDLPSHGRFWIAPATGMVLMTELVVQNREVGAVIDVRYQTDPQFAVAVPAEMRERTEGRTNGSRIDGVATYDRFRQFQVNVDEKFLLKK
jgi:hypothetical protein